VKVERKVSLEQSIQRVASIILNFKKNKSNVFPRSICFCLTPMNCEKAASMLNSLGIQSAVFSSESNKEAALTGFHDGSIHVLCATSALGRGVHIEDPIRFIFHLFTPASLTGIPQ
jgi:superfamily II DNA helicase RecQ